MVHQSEQKKAMSIGSIRRSIGSIRRSIGPIRRSIGSIRRTIGPILIQQGLSGCQ